MRKKTKKVKEKFLFVSALMSGGGGAWLRLGRLGIPSKPPCRAALVLGLAEKLNEELKNRKEKPLDPPSRPRGFDNQLHKITK